MSAPSSPQKKIGFDYSHNNKLKLEGNSFVDFLQFMFEQGYALGKIQLEISPEKLQAYDVFVVGNASDSYLEMEEIDTLVNYVREGGSLLVISDEGGDYTNRTNMSDLTEAFGVTFNSDIVIDETNHLKKPTFPVIETFEPHFITQNVQKIVHSSGCSLTIRKSIESEFIDVTPLAYGGEEARRKIFNGREWVEQPAARVPIIAASHYYKGKVVCLGNVSTFSSLGKHYGIRVLDNRRLIANVFSWLVNKASASQRAEKPIYYSVALDQDLYYFVQKLVKNKNWPDFSAVVNFSLKTLRNAMITGDLTEIAKKEAASSKLEKAKTPASEDTRDEERDEENEP